MEPPRPRAELVVQRHQGASLTIYTTSPDAAAWVAAHAGTYGSLLPALDGAFILYISPAYDSEEVARYIESYCS